LCAQIAAKYQVVGILHPLDSAQASLGRIRSLGGNLRKHGAAATLLNKLSTARLVRLGWKRAENVRRAERRFFADAQAAYDSKARHLARDIADINSPESVRLLSELRADVVICLGGPVYRSPLIEASKLVLNYHTGVSPIYNGASTVFWTFANKHIHLSGGTLMVMNKIVDGGDILAHYLCPIEPDDDPGTLLMKAVMGGTRTYDNFLQHLSRGGHYVQVPQTGSFFNYRSAEWMVCHDVATQRNIDRGLCRQFTRAEELIEYWRLGSVLAGRQALRENIARWVCNV
jgi:methionyl-tRNA formyltransferase